jgi:hypothetical protein
MSSTKRVSGTYTIIADNTVVDGNLTVLGTTTSVESQDTLIKDRFITLNAGELGAGVTLGSPASAGIEIDRGSLANTGIRWNESVGQWELTNDGTLWEGLATSALALGGSSGDVQFNDGGTTLGGESNFNYDKTTNTLVLNSLQFSGSTIETNATNANLNLDTNGTGYVRLNAQTRLQEVSGTPTYEIGHNFLYANVPGGGDTGLYFVNSNNNADELISKKKAQLLALIF